MFDCLTGKDAPRVLYEAHASHFNLLLNTFIADSRCCSICQEIKQKFGYTGVVNHKQATCKVSAGANVMLVVFHGRLQSTLAQVGVRSLYDILRGVQNQEGFGNGVDLTYRIS